MANKIAFSKLNLKKNEDFSVIKIAENEIEVLKYLPLEDKNALISVAIREAEGNTLLLECFFYLNIVFMYSNLTFTQKQREDLPKLYDLLEANGVIDAIVGAIPDEEFSALFKAFEDECEREKDKEKSLAGILNALIEELPKNVQIASEMLENFDKDAMQNVVNFAAAANAGRPINTLGVTSDN